MSTSLSPLASLSTLITKGTTPTTLGYAHSDSGIPFLRVQNIFGGQVNFEADTLFIGSDTHTALKRSQIQGGDVLVTIAGTIGRTGVVPIGAPSMNCNQAVAIVRPTERVERSYLRHWLESQDARGQMVGSTVTGTISNLSLTQLGELKVPLPPLEEQRRIAAILDQAEALRTQRRAALAQLDSLTQSIFLDMFGEQTEFPLLALDKVCELITDGTHYTPTYADEGVIFLSAKNVTSGRIDWDRIKHIPEDLHRELHKRVSPKLGDVLMAKNGTTGVAAIVDRDCTFDIYVSLALLRPSIRVSSVFLHAALNSPLSKKQFNAALKGIGVPNLHLKDIRGSKIPVPPLPLQQTFATRIQAIESLKATHRAALAELDALFASLQQRAFAGAL